MRVLEMLNTFLKSGNNRTYTIVCVLLVCFIATERFFHEKLRLKLQKIIFTEIHKINPQNQISEIDYFYFPPKLLFKDIDFRDKKETTNLKAERGALHLSLTSLVWGQIKIKKVVVKNADLKTQLVAQKKEDSSPPPQLNLDFILRSVPVETIDLRKTKVHVTSKDFSASLRIQSALFQKNNTKMWLEISSENILSNRRNEFNFFIKTNLNWGKKGIFITNLNITKDSSNISLTGLFQEEVIQDIIENKNPIAHTNELRTASKIHFQDMKGIFPFLPIKNKDFVKFLQEAQGDFKIKGNLLAEENLKKKREGRIKFNVQNLKTKFSNVPELSFKATVKNSTLFSEDLKVKMSEKSYLSFSELKIAADESGFSLDSKMESKYIELRELLGSLNANAKNVSIPFSVKGRCKGEINKRTLIKCSQSGKLLSAKIAAPNKKGSIIDINSASYQVESFISSQDIKLQVDAKRSDSEATATGIIDYKNGFSIDFDAPKVSYTKFVNQIASSSLKGEGVLSGNVSGDSRSAYFALQTSNQNLEFNELFLDKSQLEVSYKYPYVQLANIKGELNSQPYTGDISFAVDTSNLTIDLVSTSLSDNELRSLFKNKFSFPEAITFLGDLKLRLSGPPDINIMDLSLSSNLKDITVFSESFENGKLVIEGNTGDWKLYEAFLIDQKRAVRAKGAIDGLKSLDVKLQSVGYQASQINFLKNMGLNLDGSVSFDMHAVGPLDGPKATGSFTSPKLFGSYRKMGGANVEYRLFQKGLKWSGEIFSKSIAGSGYIPFESTEPFSFDGKLRDFDLVNILAIAKDSTSKPLSKLSGQLSKIETQQLATGKLTGRVNKFDLKLSAPNIETLHIQQNSKNNNLTKSLHFNVEQGDSLAKCDLEFFFKNLNNMFFRKKGLLDLNFIRPFIGGSEQLDGFLDSDFKLSVKNGVTKGNGKSLIKDFSYRSSFFPYTFNSGSARIDWNAKYAKFTNLYFYLNGAKIAGYGKLFYQPSFLLDFFFEHKNLRLELPEKVQSASRGVLSLKGSQLPLRLSGQIDVMNGLFAMDILGSNSSYSIQPSHLLPNRILKKDSSPFELDLNIKLVKPFEINNSEVKGFALGAFNMRGLTSSPRLSGRIDILKDTKLIFQDKQFNVNEGHISYSNKPPQNPDIYIDSESLLTDRNNLITKDYTVRMIIKGSGSDPKLEFSSQPSLDENQIISLIALGTVSTQNLDQEIGQEQQATQSGLQLGSYLLQQNQAIKDFQKQTGTELELSSSVDSVGVNPKVGIKKSWTPKFSSNLSQTFGNQKQLSLDNKYKINKNLSTVLKLQNSRTDDASLIINRRVPDGNVLGLDLEYNMEFK